MVRKRRIFTAQKQSARRIFMARLTGACSLRKCGVLRVFAVRFSEFEYPHGDGKKTLGSSFNPIEIINRLLYSNTKRTRLSILVADSTFAHQPMISTMEECSLVIFVVNVIAGLIAYCHRTRQSSLDINRFQPLLVVYPLTGVI